MVWSGTRLRLKHTDTLIACSETESHSARVTLGRVVHPTFAGSRSTQTTRIVPHPRIPSVRLTAERARHIDTSLADTTRIQMTLVFV